MVTSVATSDNDHDDDQIVNLQVGDDQAVIDSPDANPDAVTTPESALQETIIADAPVPGAKPIKLFGVGTSRVTLPADQDLLKGFNPDDYKDGAEGDLRIEILDRHLGLLVGENGQVETMKMVGLRQKLWEWNRLNRPPLDPHELSLFIKEFRGKWMHYHTMHQTPGYVPKRVLKG